MSHQVFICAAPRDKIPANAIRAVLEAEGVACWIAGRDLPASADPVETAGAAIAAAQVLVLVFSSRANEAEEQIKRELQFAAQHQTPVLPFRVENVKPVRGLEYFLPANQFVDAFTPPLDGHLRRLAAMLKPVLEKAAPRPPMPASLQPAAAMPESPAATVPAPDIAPRQPEASQPVVEPPTGPAMSPEAALQADLPAAPILEGAMEAAPAAAEPLFQGARRPAEPRRDDNAAPWLRKPLVLALAAVLVIAVGVGLWWLLRPGPKAQELQAWNSASQADAIPAYQGYLTAWPKGFYRDQATARAATLKSEAEAAFAKAKAANSSAAYESFLATYARQGVDVSEARAADDAARAQEAKIKAAFDAATAAHSRDSYKIFLADFPSSAYATDARQRLAACRTETRTTTTVKSTPLSESADGSGGSSAEACQAARERATKQATNSCREGRMGSVRIVSEKPATDGLQGGRILGSIFGAISGSRKVSWKCSEQIAASCEVSTSGPHQVDVCP
jgi:TIR domain